MKLPTKNFKRLLPYIGTPLDNCYALNTKIVKVIDVVKVNNNWCVEAHYTCKELGSMTLSDHFHFDKVAYDRDKKLKDLLG